MSIRTRLVTERGSTRIVARNGENSMSKFSRIVALSFAFVLAISLAANAATPFSAKAFEDAQTAGKSILIEVTAPWCPVCKAQRPTLESIEKERPNLVAFQVDFDSSKHVLKRFGVQKQSTLIVFKGTNEVGRSTGETDAARIRALIAKGF